MIVNPVKCVFGVRQAEFVGHTIDKDGKHFNRERLDKVLQIQRPETGKGLKSFLGVATWFGRHVKDFSTKTRSLQDLVKDYATTKHKKIKWTPETIADFETIKRDINQCPKLFFVKGNAPIYLNTDACDYGIGAYLYTLDEYGNEIPISFMSKLLTKTQMRWSTFEKEGYAIYAAVMKFYHILGDKKFTIKTDHKNLTFIRDSGSPKVQRWKQELMQFDFDIEYIEGENNTVADGFSRIIEFDEAELREAKGLPPRPIERIHHIWEESDLQNKFIIRSSEELKEQLRNYFNTSQGTEQVAAISNHTPLSEEVMAKIAKVHNALTGHCGLEVTRSRLTQSKVTWEGMRRDIRQFIDECPCCQKMSQIKPAIHAHPFTLATYQPMQRISMDSIGPLSPDAFGHTYITVIIDHFTRWVELYATQSTTAEELAPKLIDYFGRYGFADEISTDGGTQFCNELVRAIFKLVGSYHLRCTPHSKEEMGIVERENKEVLRHIRTLVFEYNTLTRWSVDFLPLVQRIVNAMVKKSTGVSPAQLLFGNALRLDRNVILDEEQLAPAQGKKLPKYISDLIKVQSALILKAQTLQQETDQYHVALRKPGGPLTEFPIGSYVLVEPPQEGFGSAPAAGKLYPPLAGPFRVVNFSGSNYSISNLLTDKTYDVNISRLREFRDNPNNLPPTDVLMRDDHQHTVEKIMKHRGSPEKKTSMWFLVRWKGYTHAEDSWEPWKEMRLVEPVHDYLRAHHMEKIIPKVN